MERTSTEFNIGALQRQINAAAKENAIVGSTIAAKFKRIEARLTAIEARLTALESRPPGLLDRIKAAISPDPDPQPEPPPAAKSNPTPATTAAPKTENPPATPRNIVSPPGADAIVVHERKEIR